MRIVSFHSYPVQGLQVLNESCSPPNFQNLTVSPLSLAAFRYLKLSSVVSRYPLSIFHFSSFFPSFSFHLSLSVFSFRPFSLHLLFPSFFSPSSLLPSFPPILLVSVLPFSFSLFIHPVPFFLSHSFCSYFSVPFFLSHLSFSVLSFSFFLFLSSSSCLLLPSLFVSLILLLSSLPFLSFSLSFLSFSLPSFFPSFSFPPSPFLFFLFFLFLIFPYHPPYLRYPSTRLLSPIPRCLICLYVLFPPPFPSATFAHIPLSYHSIHPDYLCFSFPLLSSI
jgi:hypothetical protein